MKRYVFTLISLVFFACDTNETDENCNFLLNVGINRQVNLNFPEFNQLQFPINAVRIEGQGNNGLIVVRINSSSLIAWDGADPNHPTTACSGLTINTDGLTATCQCDDENTYDLTTGLATSDSPQPCTLKAYRVEDIGNNTFLVSN
jgi:hypothetical protein